MRDVTNLVAVYGSLRKGLGNHGVLGDSELLGTTQVHGFEMISLGGFPAIYDGEGEITIEVYSMDSEMTAKNLDMLEGYPTFYNRKIIETEFGDAWVYFFDNPTRYPQIKVEEGDWVVYRKGEGYVG